MTITAANIKASNMVNSSSFISAQSKKSTQLTNATPRVLVPATRREIDSCIARSGKARLEQSHLLLRSPSDVK